MSFDTLNFQKQTLCKHLADKRKKTFNKYILSNIDQTNLMQPSSKLYITKALIAISFNIFEDELGKHTTTLRWMDLCWKTSWRIIIECLLPGEKDALKGNPQEPPLDRVLQYPPEWSGWGTAPAGKGGARAASKIQLLKARWRNVATQTEHISSRARTKAGAVGRTNTGQRTSGQTAALRMAQGLRSYMRQPQSSNVVPLW